MGLIKRSFVLRAAYHGLQHKLGRLDYGKLVAFGLRSIARIPVVDLERIAYENFKDHVKPRLYEGVVEHFNALRREGTAVVLVSSSPGIVINPLAIYLGCADTLTTPVRYERLDRLVGLGRRRRRATARGSSTGRPAGPRRTDSTSPTPPPTPTTGATAPCSSASAAPSPSTRTGCSRSWPSAPAGRSSAPPPPEACPCPAEGDPAVGATPGTGVDPRHHGGGTALPMPRAGPLC